MGVINIDSNLKIATGYQVVLAEDKELTTLDFFKKYHPDPTSYSIEKDINDILAVVNLKVTNLSKIISSFS
ncbi:MAG: hypothetical protein P1U46_04815 [Patescibacteria group bacterium]|nr:hypothetical protein [Patescibacteria group bacterium]